MKNFLAAFGRLALRVGRTVRRVSRLALDWLAVPVNLCLASLGAVFLVSLLAWAIADQYTGYLLYFSDARSGAVRAEIRDLPRTLGAEARAELIASEVLLGPRDPNLVPDFNQGSMLNMVMLRSRRLYVDISDDAAAADRASIALGVANLKRSLGTALPFTRQITVTVGGYEPYADYPPQVPEDPRKKQKNN